MRQLFEIPGAIILPSGGVWRTLTNLDSGTPIDLGGGCYRERFGVGPDSGNPILAGSQIWEVGTNILVQMYPVHTGIGAGFVDIDAPDYHYIPGGPGAQLFDQTFAVDLYLTPLDATLTPYAGEWLSKWSLTSRMDGDYRSFFGNFVYLNSENQYIRTVQTYTGDLYGLGYEYYIHTTPLGDTVRKIHGASPTRMSH
jgi:hypothetical protein